MKAQQQEVSEKAVAPPMDSAPLSLLDKWKMK
jgi:hypothetical protein